MRHGNLALILILILCASSAGKASASFQQTLTLFVPQDKTTGKYVESRAVFSFKRGTAGFLPGEDWDLGYGFVAINNEDWFQVSLAKGKRDVMKDLGELNWSDQYKVPVLAPLPELAEGERRHITVDTSGDTHKAWAATTQIFAKVIVGHLYVIHVKDEHSDFYALFRVEELEQRDHCTISWKLIDSPEYQDR